VTSKESGLEVNADKTKYMVMSRDQNAGRSYSIQIDNSFFERMEEFQIFGKNLNNQKSIQEKINSRLKSSVRECLLPFGAESFVFQFSLQKFKN
jgi:hypothetical protein